MGISALRSWLAAAPAGTLVPASAVLALLGDVEEPEPAPPAPTEPIEWTWRERLWVVPAETRLTTRDALEALGRSRSWLYSRLASIPHRKLDGELVFAAGELRAWIEANEAAA